MSEAVDPRFAPPQAHVADVASDGVVLAGRGARFLAAVVDVLIAAGVGWAAMLIPVFQPLVKAGEAGTRWMTLTPVSVVVGMAVLLLVQGWPLVARGQTLGKMLFKMRIVRSDGSRPSAWRLLGLRYGVGMLSNINPVVSAAYGLVDSLLIFRESRKCLHDSIADTQVIKL